MLADTPIWSLALRRRAVNPESIVLTRLIDDFQVAMIGPIRQELLSGISDRNQFETLRERLSSFQDTPISTEVYESAASFFNICRAKGIQGSHTDFLICATAVHHEYLIYTTDQDFMHYSRYLPIRFFTP